MSWPHRLLMSGTLVGGVTGMASGMAHANVPLILLGYVLLAIFGVTVLDPS